VAFRLHDELAGDVTESAGRAGERDLRQCLVDLDAAFDQGEAGDALAGPGVAAEVKLSSGSTAVRVHRVENRGQWHHLAERTPEALLHIGFELHQLR